MNMMRKTVMAARIAAACVLSASVCAEAADIPEGRYAYYDDGIYYTTMIPFSAPAEGLSPATVSMNPR